MSGWLIRLLLFVIVVTLLVRSLWRFLVGVVEGGNPTPRRTQRAEKRASLVRDPVCGTFIVPSRALTVGHGETTQYFCSERCRDEYARRQ